MVKKTEEEVKVIDEITETVDEELFPGGPMVSKIDEWKNLYGQVYMTELDDDDTFIWRVLSRREFKEVMKLEEVDALYREEKVCEHCIIWPENYSFNEINGGKAGVPTVLSEQIMEKSGFAPKTGPILL